jgi:cyclic pyranopterin phosphate synthase
MVKDIYGRTFRKLRVSLASHCNFSCTYCTGVVHELKPVTEGRAQMGDKENTFQQMLDNIGKIHRSVNLESVRLTGGEPLLNPAVVDAVVAIKAMGIEDVRMTTNGFLLPQYAERLAKAGLASVNISLDALSETAFHLMTRRKGLKQVLKGVDAALAAGLEVKLNTVLMLGKNEAEILPLLNYAAEKGVIIRYLELMGMGPVHHTSKRWLFSRDKILAIIQSAHEVLPIPRKDGSTANYWQTETGQVFGIIANESDPFCSDCDRLRLDANGKIYGCISSKTGINISDARDSQTTEELLVMAMQQKQEVRFTGSEISMMVMGG